MRTCTKCGTTKPENQFSNKGRGKNNFASFGENWDPKKNTCKACDAAYARKFRENNPGYRGSGKNKKYPEEDRLLISAIRRRLNVCKATYRKRNDGVCESDLTDDYLYDLYKKQNGLCIYTGTKMLLKKGHPATISIDKIVPDKGYVQGNVQWICWAVNRAKGDLKESEFLRMCKVITERCNDYPAREYSQVAGSAQPLAI